LSAINLSCNELSEESGQALVTALKKKCNLVSLDTRKNHLDESSSVLADIVKRAELSLRQEDVSYL